MSSPRKTAIVTGGSQGIGAGIVKAFAERGFNGVASSGKMSRSTDVAASEHVAQLDVKWLSHECLPGHHSHSLRTDRDSEQGSTDIFMSAGSAIHFDEPRFGEVQISLHNAQGLVIDPMFVAQINERLILNL